MGKVTAGFFSFTEITEPGAHRAYNEWHQLDHMPEQFPLRGIAGGQRWVSTPACRRARAVNGDALAPIHYMTLYLLSEPIEESLSEFSALAQELHDRDRFFAARRAHLSGPFDLEGSRAARRVRISAEAVPYRPNLGAYVVVEPAGAGGGPLDTLSEVPGVAGAWSFSARRWAKDRRFQTGDHDITVCWLDQDPLVVATRLQPVFTERWARSPSTPVLAGPFETVTAWEWDWFDEATPA